MSLTFQPVVLERSDFELVFEFLQLAKTMKIKAIMNEILFISIDVSS